MNEKAIETGGPAFPMADPFVAKQPKTSAEAQKLAEGMSLRDYFAAKAMQGNLASMVEGQEFDPGMGATWAYKVADAMLEARGDCA